MRLSAYFLPTLKETPAEAEIVSHRLMLRAGMVRQASAGVYSWLPLGFRVLKRLEEIGGAVRAGTAGGGGGVGGRWRRGGRGRGARGRARGDAAPPPPAPGPPLPPC